MADMKDNKQQKAPEAANQSLREQVYSVISSDSNASAARTFGGMISVLVIASVAIIVIDTCDIPKEVRSINLFIQGAISVVFTIEYLLRFWVSDLARPDMSPASARLKFFISPASIIDLLSFLPFWLFWVAPFDLRFLAAFRVLRVMRLLRLRFYSKALSVVGSVLKSCAKQLVATLLLLLLLMLVASIFMYNAEHAVQPEVFDNALSGYWWALQTVTTIGYGDIYPVTILGRLIGIVIALLGVGMVAIPTGIISAAFVAWGRAHQTDEDTLEKDKQTGSKPW